VGHLFDVKEGATKLSAEEVEIFHHLVAKLLCLSKRARPDLLLTIAFLATRVKEPDTDDCKKLGRCLSYLRETPRLPMTLTADNMHVIFWWVDASFTVHPNCHSHTGATLSFGGGCPINMSIKQKINARSSAEAEVVSINDVLALILWTCLFPEAQGVHVEDNIIFQDNMSSIPLEKNGKRSSGKKTRHMDIRCFFVTDNVKRQRVSICCCPTDLMWADGHTKPLQGSQFCLQRALLLNPQGTPELEQFCQHAMPHVIRHMAKDVSISAQRPGKPLASLQECVGTSGLELGTQAQPIRAKTYAEVVSSDAGLPQAPRVTQTSSHDEPTSLVNLK